MDGEGSRDSSLLSRLFTKKRIILLIVYVALFLDSMLMSTIVPVLPFYLEGFRDVGLALNNGSTDLRINDSYNANQAMFLNESLNEADYAKKANVELHLEDSAEIGLLLGSKALMQIMINPIVGPLTNRIGYTIPLFAGFVIIFVSTLTFAFSRSYAIFLLARATQGLGSACCSTAGLGSLAATFTDPQERAAAMSVAVGGVALGVLAGFPFAGVMYDLAGKASPFLILAAVALADAVLQLVFMPPKYVKRTVKGSTILKLLCDPYIVLSAVAITIACAGGAILETSLPLWMKQMMNTTPSTSGLAFIPITLFYLITVHSIGPLTHRIGRWLLSSVGLAMCGISLTLVPSARTIYELIFPNALFGVGAGLFKTSIITEMSNLADIRHVGVYGNVFAIVDSSVCIAFFVGPFVTGPIIRAVGFSILLYIIGGLILLYAPLLLFLRNPAPRSSPTLTTITTEAINTINRPASTQ